MFLLHEFPIVTREHCSKSASTGSEYLSLLLLVDSLVNEALLMQLFRQLQSLL